MVAVPTVLGIASIRVYTVKEVSADGLVTREKVYLCPSLSHNRRQLLTHLIIGPNSNNLTLASVSS